MDQINDENWQYINHGGANLVLGYTGNDKKFIGTVLRLRRYENGVCSRQIYEYMKSSKFDQLRQWIVPMGLVEISEELTKRFNVVNERHAIIMPNLLGIQPIQFKINKYIKIWKSSDGYVLELKPKWLNQKKSLNCRNCLIALEKKQEFILCPLWLLHDIDGIEFWSKQVQSKLKVDLEISIKDAIIKNIKLLETLKDLQDDNIQQLMLNLNEEKELQFQMTIRDVSVFLNLQTGDAKILDLDLKPLDKRQSWINDDNKLKVSYNDESIGLQCPI